jgi:Flp pilus assembly protein TadB
MTEWPIQIPLPLAAAAAAVYAAWLIWTLIVRQRVLAGRDAVQTERMLMSDTATDQLVAAKSLQFQLAEAGLTIDPTTFNLIRLACAALAFGLTTLFGLPIVIRLVVLVAGWAAPLAWLAQRRSARERSIDDDLPAALSGLAASLSISKNLAEALESAAEAVSPTHDEQPRLLATLLRDTATLAQTGGGMTTALRELQQHSPSPTLAMLAFNLRMYDTTGEDKFTRQIIDTATRVRTLLEGRKRARAYAASARSVVLLIVGLTVVMFALAFQDPAFAAYYQSGRGTLALLVIGGIMAVAYWSMQHLLDEVG